MSVQGVSSATSTSSTQTTSLNAFSGYGSNEFMQMLMTQLTHQNPLEPMKDADMMNQYAQLNSLSELQSIKSNITTMAATNLTGYAASLIGKTVKAEDTSGNSISGVVDSVSLQDGNIQLHIGKLTVPLGNVSEIIGG
jgi:flagellar basal-body rod modification protein FlgD